MTVVPGPQVAVPGAEMTVRTLIMTVKKNGGA